jgi:enamine deaminase RidA (YjgF/YER057c/UK114 family)
VSRHHPLNPPSLPAPRGFSHGVVASGERILFVAGQIGCDAKGAIASSDLVDQFERALRNVMEVVVQAGGGPESIARMTVYVTDLIEYRARLKGIGEAWRRVMGKRYPAMCLVEVNRLFEPTAKVELEATAVL